MLSPDEYGLFRERIRMTDKKLNPGLTKLLWSSMGSSKVFIRDGLVHVDEVEHPPITVLSSHLHQRSQLMVTH